MKSVTVLIEAAYTNVVNEWLGQTWEVNGTQQMQTISDNPNYLQVTCTWEQLARVCKRIHEDMIWGTDRGILLPRSSIANIRSLIQSRRAKITQQNATWQHQVIAAQRVFNYVVRYANKKHTNVRMTADYLLMVCEVIIGDNN